jgi:hypothetical protein
MRALNCHPEIRCLREPFNPDQFGSKYLGGVQDLSSLGSALAGIWQTHNGIKHVWDPSGWPFGAGMAFNLYLATRPGQRVLFLTRRNHLQRLVSYELAVQTNIWHREDIAASGKSPGPGLAPLDPASLRRNIYLSKATTEAVKRTLAHNGISFLEVFYEELFAPYATVTDGMRRLGEIAEFLSAEPLVASEMIEKARHLLNAESHKLNTELTYRSVPNFETIERLCGSNETGYLFEQTPAREEESCASLSSRSRAAEARLS